MLEIPTKIQFTKWSKPSKATLKSYWLSVFMALFTIITFTYSQLTENHETKEMISVTLKEFKTSLKQMDYIQKEYNPGNVYLGTQEGIIDAINKLNKHNKEVSNLIDFEKLYNLIKDYGNDKINQELYEFSYAVQKDAKDLSMYVANIEVDKIQNQDEFNIINEHYLAMVNKLHLALAKYHGFILSLTLKDFDY